MVCQTNNYGILDEYVIQRYDNPIDSWTDYHHLPIDSDKTKIREMTDDLQTEFPKSQFVLIARRETILHKPNLHNLGQD